MKQLIIYKGFKRIDTGIRFTGELEASLINHRSEVICGECNEMISSELVERCNTLGINLLDGVTGIVIEEVPLIYGK